MNYQRHNSHATHRSKCLLLEISPLHGSEGPGHTWFPEGLTGPQLWPGNGASGSLQMNDKFRPDNETFETLSYKLAR